MIHDDKYNSVILCFNKIKHSQLFTLVSHNLEGGNLHLLLLLLIHLLLFQLVSQSTNVFYLRAGGISEFLRGQ